MTRAQLKPYWRAVARAAFALGHVGKDAVEEYRHQVMMEEVGAAHASDVDPAAGFDRVMYRLAIDAGDWAAASRFATGEERRLAHLVEQCARQVVELKACEDGPEFAGEAPAARAAALDYILGVMRQAGFQICSSDAGEWWLDISGGMAFNVFRMLNTHRRRILKRFKWSPLSFEPAASWYLDGDSLAVAPVADVASILIHVGRVPA